MSATPADSRASPLGSLKSLNTESPPTNSAAPLDPDWTGQTDLSHTSVPTSPTSHFLSLLTSGFMDDEKSILDDKTLTRDEKQDKITQLFSRACANGQVQRVKQLWESLGPQYIDLNAKDDDGTTPLINTACFGHSDVADYLLSVGCNVDIQDRFGWTALMWATNNHHDGLVRLFLDHGAKTTTKSAGGKTAMDMIQHGYQQNDDQSQKLYDLIAQSDHTVAQSPTGVRSRDGGELADPFGASLSARLGATHSHRRSGGELGSPHSDLARLRINGDHSADPVPKPFSPTGTSGPGTEDGAGTPRKTTRSGSLASDLGSITEQGFYSGPGNPRRDSSGHDFVWDQCQPDQMYVISPAAVPLFLAKVIKNVSPSLRLRANPYEKFIPANLLFLTARYAFYFGTPDFLAEFTSQAIAEITQLAKRQQHDVELLAFWLSNCTLLLYYFKKDTGLVVNSVEIQGQLSELIQEIYQTLVRSVQAQLDRILQPAILEYEAIPDLFASIQFEARPTNRFGRAGRGTAAQSGGSKRRSFFGLGPALASDSWSAPSTDMPQLRRSASLAARRSSVRASKLYPINTPSPQVGHQGPPSALVPPSPKGTVDILSPKHINALLSSLLNVIKTCGLHPGFAFAILCQVYYYMGAELFNMFMLTPNYCCRARAMMVRMNLTQVEDWTRRHHLPVASLNERHLGPVVQLLQLLQCYSQLQDLPGFVDLTSKFTRLNPLHYRIVADNYTYEVNEPHVAQDVAEYINKVAEDIDQTQRQLTDARRSWSAAEDVRSRATSRLSNSSRPPSMDLPESLGSPTHGRSHSPSVVSIQSNSSLSSQPLASSPPPHQSPLSPSQNKTALGITLGGNRGRKLTDDSTSDQSSIIHLSGASTPRSSTRNQRAHHQLFKPSHLYSNPHKMTDFIDPDFLQPFAIPTPAELESWWLNGGGSASYASTSTDSGADVPDIAFAHPQGIIPIVPEEFLRELDSLSPS
ncbi:hypothetical protein H4R34_002447 [Dimargaris verticillata]|uniref:Dilute domain-containing protein n=1 Tax=Dimargaris verticillata TaxID=2761393 RepID=A0A9W8E9Z5_9FUNG|nr:hypothetical protein H4R34_002447 [Dimargaris verticillata]